MAFFTTKRSLLVACAALLTAGLFQSCSDSPSTMSNKDIADLQKQLDSTMRLYHNVKAQNAEYDQQMASRDSAITAQAAEIQSLIDQLNGKAPAKNTVANKTDQSVIEIPVVFSPGADSDEQHLLPVPPDYNQSQKVNPPPYKYKNFEL